MARHPQRVVRWIVVVSLGLAGIGCSGGTEEAARPVAPAEQAQGIVCDRFELRWELDGEDLLLAIDTDLPDEGELSVSVSRSYYEVGNDDEYARGYLSVFEPVSRWREPRRIPLDADAWAGRSRSTSEPHGGDSVVGTAGGCPG